MDVSRPLEVARIDELKIVHNVRLIHKLDLNPIYSKDNLRVQFSVSGDLKGAITCFLCLDGKDVSETERNYLFPLFVEAMNILVGRQLSLDEDFSKYRIMISPPKLNMLPSEFNTAYKQSTQKYELELDDQSFDILAEYTLEAIN